MGNMSARINGICNPGTWYQEYPENGIFNRHAESRDHVTIGCGHIFRLRKDKDWITVLYLMNNHFIAF